MTEKSNGGPAFPSAELIHETDDGVIIQKTMTAGMSLRDYFAAKALAGILADPLDGYDGVQADDPECETKLQKQRIEIATNCYHFADAMLKAREQ